ncbi:MAG: nucleotidyl transferase AbiEii/AbiGii toxin family protein [Pleurocapsa sp. SU_5_0]|nr:nucleotidyl transferase AbiEii/AbiGii toxin family protein [Pleurocapsa sp. SU_5_0]
MDIRRIRELVIIAMFADDDLMETLVLKGGNALDIAHDLKLRASVDVDFSMSDDFEDLEAIESKIERTLSERFDSEGYQVFDYRFKPKPKKASQEIPDFWGGYQVEFKIIEAQKYDELQLNLDNLRRNATTIGSEQQRTFKIDISKHEYCDSKEELELDDYIIYVYTLPMILIEKLRALCQQMPEYPLRGKGRARARDVFDIYSIITEKSVDIASSENQELFKSIFSAKEVPLSLLSGIKKQREFHRPDWAAVEQSVSTSLKSFDFYYDFLEELVENLKSLGIE